MARTANPLILGRKAKPTKKHRPAVWENMLGTVYAMDARGLIRYFDYDYEAALVHAGIDASDPSELDLRTARPLARDSYPVRYGDGRDSSMEPRRSQLVLWRLR